jgi:AraC-like DNA-binding protein
MSTEQGKKPEPLGGFPTARASDVTEAERALTGTFLPARVRPSERLGVGGVGMRLNAIPVGQATVAYMQFGRDVEVATTEAVNYHVDLPTRGVAHFRSERGAREGTSRRAGVFMPGESAVIDWSGGCAQFCLMFPRALVQQELEGMLDAPVTKPIEFPLSMDVSHGAGRGWLTALRLVEQQTTQACGLLDHPLATANLESLLVHGLLLGQPHNFSEALAGPRRPTGPSAVRQAIELMRDQPAYPWTTTALARSVCVSVRGLQEGFARSVGIPPMRYLREVRLHRAYKDLRSADPYVATVEHVARRWGFTSLGRFASVYREKFGENPSDTLRTNSASR